MRKLVIAAAILCGGAASAAAADIRFKAPMAPAPVVAPSWTGPYVGLHAGYGWGEWDVDLPGVTIDGDGWFGGLQAGYNVQHGNWVWGLEADISWSGFKGDESYFDALFVRNDLEYFGTVRGRSGFVTNNWLWYATGGFAWGRAESKIAFDLGFIDGSVNAKTNHIGWTVGGGVEVMAAPNWTWKLEYLYVDLGEADYAFGVIGPIGISVPSDITFHSVRFGANYKF